MVVLTQSSLYNFKRNHFARPQRQFPLERIEAIFLSEESQMSMIIRLIDEKHLLKIETLKRALFVTALQETYMQKTQRKLKVVEITQALFDKALSEGMPTRQLEKRTEMLRHGSFDEDDMDSDMLLPKGSPLRSRGDPTRASANGTEAPESPVQTKKSPPPKPKRRSIVDTVLRRGSVGKNVYKPVCPPCSVKVGVVQPIWSLVERALEPLASDDKPPPGLVRCADILVKCVGAEGPKSTEQAMKAVAALCFDKDAARALLKSLSDNVPILGGSALVDSLDALQRSEDATVRRWAIKSLWKLLPMCMAENALPTTSNKWMSALNGNATGQASQQGNQGEEAFLTTYFGRGAIPHGTHEQEPLRRIMRRKGSFNLLGGGFKSNTDFPQGLTPVLVQQGFSHVLLQNLFDLQRRAAFSIAAAKTDPAHRPSPDGLVVQGLVESDCVTLLELLLNSLVKPQDAERRIDVIGKRIRNPALMPTLMGILVLLQDDSVRQSVLKDVSLLLLRSETNLKTVLDIPNWQLLFIPLLQTVPRAESMRNAEQRILHKYVLNLLTMIHTYCFKEASCKGGPLNVMLGETFHSLAVFGDWSPDTIGVARWILFGLVAQLGLTARSWWHDDAAPEWMALSLLLKTIEVFVFFLPEQQSRAVAHSSSGLNTPSPAASPAVTGGKTVVAERAMRKADPSGMRASKDSMSEDDSDSDDEGPRSRKARKRKFSITPVYELKGFDPVVRPLGPSDALASRESFAWIPQRLAGASDKLATDAHVGLHLNSETGKSLDIKLVESVVELLKRMGLTGEPAEDDRRREALKSASKRAKGLLKTASEWLTTMIKIRELLDDLDVASDATNANAVQSTMARVNQFFQVRYGAKASSTKLASIQAKAVATKLEASVLRQRQLAKHHLEHHKVVQPVKVARPVIVAADAVAAGGSQRKSNLSATAAATAAAAAAAGGKLRDARAETHRSSIVARTRFYSSVGTDGEDSSAPPLPQMPPLNELAESVLDGGADDDVADGPPCDACGLPCSDDFDAVEKFGSTFHADCFTCDECKLPLLKSENPDENNLFFNDGELKKFCGPECRGTMLGKVGRDVCPGCMTLFRKGEKAIEACGRLWHVAHLRCNDCRCTLGSGAKQEFFPVEFGDGDLWPLCGDCHAKRFRTCAKCNQPIEAKDDAVDALGRVYHTGHFGCVRCGEPLGSEFYVDGHGESARALCDACWNTAVSPRIACDACGEVLADTDDAIELAGRIYHVSASKKCFCCATCRTPLKPGEVFEVDERPTCDACFFASKGHACARCAKLITTEELVAEGKAYHPECFQCPKCPAGLVMTGRYLMTDAKTPMCETHWTEAFAKRCAGCGLQLDAKERAAVQGKDFHPRCLVCAHCRVPLLDGAAGGAALNVGPDEKFYCGLHAQGVCAMVGCAKPAFKDGEPLRRIADAFYCQHHFDVMSQQWMMERCHRCFAPIREGDGLRAMPTDNWYHKSKGCFVCFVCDEPFVDGEVFEILHGAIDGEPVHKRCV